MKPSVRLLRKSQSQNDGPNIHDTRIRDGSSPRNRSRSLSLSRSLSKSLRIRSSKTDKNCPDTRSISNGSEGSEINTSLSIKSFLSSGTNSKSLEDPNAARKIYHQSVLSVTEEAGAPSVSSTVNSSEDSTVSTVHGSDVLMSSTTINVNQTCSGNDPLISSIEKKGNDHSPCDYPDHLDGADAENSYYSCWYPSSVCSSLAPMLMPCFPQNHELYDNENDYTEEHPEAKRDPFSYCQNGEDVTEIECTMETSSTVDENKQELLIEEDSKKSGTCVTPQLQPQHHLPSYINKTMVRPSEWMQRPLLLVATPNSGMVVRRIRRVMDPSFFDSSESIENSTDNGLAGDKIQLPINNGKEDLQHSLVIDFETPTFAGSALFRIRDCNTSKSHSATSNAKNNNTGHDYFAKYNRKFQMVIRGKFLQPKVIMADCVSGMLLERRLATAGSPTIACAEELNCSGGLELRENSNSLSQKTKMSRLKGKSKSDKSDNLPPKWALRAAVRVAGFFSPRMDGDLECANPRILSPLCSTAQTVYMTRGNENSLEGGRSGTSLDGIHSEPHPHSRESLAYNLKKTSVKKSGTSVQYRKRAFDAVYDERVESLQSKANQMESSRANSNDSPCFDPSAEYTFEFLQHLVDYNELSLDLGMALGKMRIGGAMRGQPIRLLAGLRSENNFKKNGNQTNCPLKLEDLNCLWSFDLWHESLRVGE